MSKGEKTQATKAETRRVTVIAIVEDTREGCPKSWATVLGTVPAGAIAIEKIVPENNAFMAKAHAMRLIDNVELLK